MRAALALMILAAPPAGAADFSDPTWPCIQRKVAELSAGTMWPAPLAAAGLAGEARREVAELAQLLALRRVDLAEAAPEIDAFAARHPPERLDQVFLAVFEALAADRARIIEGIGEFAGGQEARAARIEAARREFAALAARPDKDDAAFDRMDALEADLGWEEQIFEDRQRSIAYLCETPVLIEKRLYAVAQALLAAKP